MVLLIRNPVAFGSEPEIVHESRRGPPGRRAGACANVGEVPHRDRNRMVLIELFHIEEAEKLVRNEGAT